MHETLYVSLEFRPERIHRLTFSHTHLIAPPSGDRKLPKFDMHHTLINSSYKFDLNVMKKGVDTL